MEASEEFKALSFIRKSLLRKNGLIRELKRKLAKVEEEAESLRNFQWKCAYLEDENTSLRQELSQYTSNGGSDGAGGAKHRGITGDDEFADPLDSRGDVGVTATERFSADDAVGGSGDTIEGSGHSRLQDTTHAQNSGPGDVDLEYFNPNDGNQEAAVKKEIDFGEQDFMADSIPKTSASSMDPLSDNQFEDGTAAGTDSRLPGSDPYASNGGGTGIPGPSLAKRKRVMDNYERIDVTAPGGEAGPSGSMPQTPGEEPLQDIGLPPDAEYLRKMAFAMEGDKEGAAGGLLSQQQQPQVLDHTAKGQKHTCHVCAATFRGRVDLERHMRVHTGEKPFACLVEGCTYRATQKAHLKRHSVHLHGVLPDL